MLGFDGEQGSQEQMAALQQERDDVLARLADATSEVQALRASAQATNGSRQVSSLLQVCGLTSSSCALIAEGEGSTCNTSCESNAGRAQQWEQHCGRE